jgi:N-acetylglucosaminyldiphosphoundecaprenol N-acetyl-beta-D-mannosaminyltransferase
VPLDASASEIVRRVVDRVGAYTEASLVDDLGRAMATEPVETAYCVHIGDLNHALRDPSYVEVLERGTYLYADGNSVRIVAAAHGRRLPERLVTTDVIWPALRRAAEGGHPVFLVGGPEGLAEAASRTMRARIPGLAVAGCANGFFTRDEAPAVADAIRRSGAHLVVVATGVPHQQRFCDELGERTGARLLMTAGGLYGYMAGHERRAPARMRAAGFEWAWRLAQDPRRLVGRYATGCLTVARLAAAGAALRGR